MERFIKKIRSIKLRILISILGTLAAPAVVFAVVQSLNGVTGQTQTFVNDSTISVVSSSSANTHTLKWNGTLPVSRGGTGAGSFTTGSILFSNGSLVSQDNANLFWDDANNLLRIGGSASISTNFEVGGHASVSGNIYMQRQTTLYLQEIRGVGGIDITAGNVLPGDAGGNPQGNPIIMTASNGLGSGGGGVLSLNAGVGGPTGDGGDVIIEAQDGGTTSGNGGTMYLFGGGVQGTGIGGSIEFNARTGAGGGANGTYRFLNPNTGGQYGFLNFESIVGSDKTFIFPNLSGTFGLLERNQIWTGLNKFEAIASSSVYVGSSTKTGCIVMGDSDGSGVTYVTANDGVLTASSIKPSICQ